MSPEQEYREEQYLKIRGLHRAQVVSDIRACLKAWGGADKLAAGLDMGASTIKNSLCGSQPFGEKLISLVYGSHGCRMIARGPRGERIETRDVPAPAVGERVAAVVAAMDAEPEEVLLEAFRSRRGAVAEAMDYAAGAAEKRQDTREPVIGPQEVALGATDGVPGEASGAGSQAECEPAKDDALSPERIVTFKEAEEAGPKNLRPRIPSAGIKPGVTETVIPDFSPFEVGAVVETPTPGPSLNEGGENEDEADIAAMAALMSEGEFAALLRGRLRLLDDDLAEIAAEREAIRLRVEALQAQALDVEIKADALRAALRVFEGEK